MLTFAKLGLPCSGNPDGNTARCASSISFLISSLHPAGRSLATSAALHDLTCRLGVPIEILLLVLYSVPPFRFGRFLTRPAGPCKLWARELVCNFCRPVNLVKTCSTPVGSHSMMALSSLPAAAACRCTFLSPLATTASRDLLSFAVTATRRRLVLSTTTTTMMAAAMAASSAASSCKVIDSHLHVWATPQQAKEEYPYFPGQEPTLRGDDDFLLECMSEAGVDGALIVQPINHMFDHSLVTSVLKKYPSKFIGCCLANPADDGSGIKQLEHLIVQEKYRAVRFNPNLWPLGQKMTNEVGRALFSKAGELGAPVGIMTMKGISPYIQEIEELCTDYPATTVILDHMAFCKPPMNDEEEKAFSSFLNLSRFPQVYVKYSALFRITREAYPYEDTAQLLSHAISHYGASRIMWGSDFPYVVPECGYKGAREAISHVASKIPVSLSDFEWILGKTASQLFQGAWVTP